MGAVRASCTGWPREAGCEALPSPQHRVEHTDEWEQIEPPCAWPGQRDHALLRPLVLFGDPVAQRAEEGASERTLYRRTSAFDLEGMESLFGSEAPKRRRLPPTIAAPSSTPRPSTPR